MSALALSGLALVLDPASATASGKEQANRAISIPAGPLSDALISLALQTGASIGLPGDLPARRAPRVHGAMRIEDALRRLLKGSGFKAVQTGPLAWRLMLNDAPMLSPVSKPKREQPESRPALPAAPDAPPPDIVVTASKMR